MPAISVLVFYLLQGRIDFNLWDEGFLWYGSMRTLAGDIPLKDFMAYDPGRYYWVASFMALFQDDGIGIVRISIYITQFIGLCIAIRLLFCKNTMMIPQALGILIILMLWFFPYWKSFDAVTSIIIIAVTYQMLVSNNTKNSFFIAGITIGLIIFFGRNHAFYAIVSIVLVGCYLFITSRDFKLSHYLLLLLVGLVLGLIPFYWLVLNDPEFLTAFWESIRFTLVEARGETIKKPIPWPWTINFQGRSVFSIINAILLGSIYILLPLYGVLGLVVIFTKALKNNQTCINPLLISSVFVSLPYTHHAFSSAGLSHLAQSIFPLLLGILSFCLSERKMSYLKKLNVGILVVATLVLMVPVQPAYRAYVANQNLSWLTRDIVGHPFLISQRTFKDLELLDTLSSNHLGDNQTFLAAPVWPGAYAYLHRKSPVWEIYQLYSRTPEFENKEINRIQRTDIGFALVLDFPVAQKEALRFKNSHPVTDRFITENFIEINKYDVPESYKIYINE